jgi:hypothetical protein
MEALHRDDPYESIFVETYTRDREISVTLIKAVSFVESLDKTREYIEAIITKYDLWKLGTEYTCGCGRYTERDGEHYWVKAIQA